METPKKNWLAVRNLLIACVAVLGASLAAPAAPKIASIHISGERQYSEAQIIAASGLQLGQDFDASALQSAAQRLGTSGAFDDVEFRYRPVSNGMDVEFTVREAAKLHGVVFDNFVWFTNPQIDDYLRKQVPLFSERLPESGTLLDGVAAALQQMLANDKIDARIERVQFGPLGSPDWVHLYSISGLELKIQTVQFQGAQGMDAATLQQATLPLVARDYSRTQCGAFGAATFIPLYRQRGYLRIAVGDPTSRVLNQPAAANQYDIEVTFPVTEGLVYTWTATQWAGNQVLASSDLSTLVGMKPGEVADGLKIDAGWQVVNDAYGKKGYVEANVNPEPVYDDANHSVTFHAAVTEGPQYHMGTFTVIGLPPAVVQQIVSKWRLKSTDVYDSSYARDFLRKDLPQILAAAKIHFSEIGVQTQPSHDTLTVDVSISFK
ncbi:MAG: POTRA domain-containing protein [Candidatus Acidiferrales bacterium]